MSSKLMIITKLRMRTQSVKMRIDMNTRKSSMHIEESEGRELTGRGTRTRIATLHERNILTWSEILGHRKKNSMSPTSAQVNWYKGGKSQFAANRCAQLSALGRGRNSFGCNELIVISMQKRRLAKFNQHATRVNLRKTKIDVTPLWKLCVAGIITKQDWHCQCPQCTHAPVWWLIRNNIFNELFAAFALSDRFYRENFFNLLSEQITVVVWCL